MNTITPPRISEVLPAVKALLNVSALTDRLGGANVYIAKGDTLNVETPSNSLASGAKSRVVLFGRKDLGHFEQLDKSFAFKFNVRVDFFAGQNDDPDAFCEYIQGICFELLQWQNITLTRASQIYPLMRKERFTTCMYDKDGGFYYQASIWSILLTSTDN